MCERTLEGYKLSSGKVIPYHDADFTKLTAEEFADLASEKVSLLEMISIRDTQHKLESQLNTVSSNVSTVLRKIDNHKDFCPINKEAVEVQVDKFLGDKLEGKVKEVIKSTILSAGGISKAVMAIFAIFVLIGGMFFALFNVLDLPL